MIVTTRRSLASRMTRWHLVTSEYPPDIGGVSDYTGQLARALAAAGDEVHVWCPGAARDGVPGIQLHAALGRMSPGDLRRVDRQLDACPGPRRLLVQWVPHGFGYRSMNLGFCLWLARRARAGDHVELMVHEPYMEFSWRSPAHSAMAAVHRLMTLVVLGAARRAWIAIPAWETCLRPYALGRAVPMPWLPIPGCVPPALGLEPSPLRTRFAPAEQPIVGHFGSHGAAVAPLLDACLPLIMNGPCRPALLLLGADGPSYRDALVARHAEWAPRVHAAGFLDVSALAAHLAVCDVMLQPYPDGVTSRRTSVMACLSNRRAVVTTAGRLTEPLWHTSRAVSLARVTDAAGMADEVVRVLADGGLRAQLGARARQLYLDSFSMERVVRTLRAASVRAA
jgi:glycosyltransferase involved in cell wall biosynthesis